jgi:hypothetical protein
MKALSTVLTIVIAAVVILVAALVILTIFIQGTSPLASLAEAKNFCRTQATPICETTGNMPFTWDIPSVSVGGVLKACSDSEVLGDKCECVLAEANDPSKGWKLSGC